MKLTRIYTTADGGSRFDDVDVPLRDAGDIGRLSARWPAEAVIFRETDASYDFDWHPAPQRQVIALLDGEIEITTSDGERRTFGPGDLLLVEDTTGRGHRTRQLSPGVRRSLFITLGPATA